MYQFYGTEVGQVQTTVIPITTTGKTASYYNNAFLAFGSSRSAASNYVVFGCCINGSLSITTITRSGDAAKIPDFTINQDGYLAITWKVAVANTAVVIPLWDK